MLKITVVAVGKLKEKFWVAACDEYLKRLRPYAKVTVAEIPDVDPARAGGVETALEREGAGILAAVLIALLLLAFDWRLGLLSLVPVVLAFLAMTSMTGKKLQDKMTQY